MWQDDFRSNFAMMIPQGPYREPKKPDSKKWLCWLIGHRWEIYMITTRDKGMPHRCKRCKKITSVQWPFKLKQLLWKCADVLFRPLCLLGWYRWKGTYRSETYFYGSPNGEKEAEQNYQCARCPKRKKINLY